MPITVRPVCLSERAFYHVKSRIGIPVIDDFDVAMADSAGICRTPAKHGMVHPCKCGQLVWDERLESEAPLLTAWNGEVVLKQIRSLQVEGARLVERARNWKVRN